MRRPKVQRPPEKFLYREELDALFAVRCAPNERLVLAALLYTGARSSEIATARVDGLRPGSGGAIVLTNEVKGGRVESWPLGPLSEEVEKTLKQREVEPSDPVFVNQHGEAYNRGSPTQLVLRLARRAGITRTKVRAHVLRHTYNVYARAGAKLDVVVRAGLLKHSSTATLQRYEHTLPDEELEARAAVWRAIRGG